MNTVWKFFQYGYLVVALICLVEGFLSWGADRQKSYMFFGASIFIILVFFFKRHFRKKVETRNNQK
ncbi:MULTISPECIES: hypothetical protein [unclassified Polaribacter]|jgi:hypothetical protein|uniref:hypothetical protein n=1 Tax=unclassified Polaribacter TaxID=196858 RepID=UPI001C4EA108|nr:MULTISPECIES: hypothetical protein [unclassified Polaribacter]QXP64379.1 hypothetical protein H0I27_04115 [Polaribacter sp. HaHaR_3_91]QXP66868.1 hypothetical protein H0I28_17220 [Polaribacter sp. AHE13PA]QXP68981.1 hypothetical protein H0I29_10030 [Polaribacter sp. R2A056_3_33]